jgi:alkanesulfonate monooxygenase SsuD/methylene tetrahydromethanopterin reductase-like flavin-dependent oxidoreductase (luciferase family)
MTSLGAIFLPQLPPERLREVALAADEAGLEELWLWEDCFRESGIATAAAALAWTRRLRVGIGLLPVPLRNVALTAMEIATLERMFPARVHVGVGHGVQDWMAQVGARVDSPMTLLREYVTALRALLRGEQLTTTGEYVRLDRVALDWPPPSPPKVFVGAIGPRTLRLAGEAADGTILTSGNSPDQARQKRRLVDEARGTSGPDDAHPVVVFVHAATGPSAAARLEEERRRWDYESMADIAVAGDAPTVAAAVQRWVDAGADSVILQPTPDDPDLEDFMRFVAREVRPLVGRAAVPSPGE